MEEQQHRNTLPKGFWLNEYQIESVLGKPGGFGITYLATDTHLRQSVAIKEYLPSDFAVREGRSTVYVKSSSYEESFQWGLKCFIEEARVLAKFNHPSIIRVLRFFEANGTAYMVMEYQQGHSLTDYLKQRRILTEDELLTIVLPLLEGLKEIHHAGFLHRDIKPNNIYIRSDLSPVLLDFGSARFAIGQKSSNVTSIVTPGYAPLEQYDNEIKDQGPWTDIYALGAVMYCAINGEPPPAATRRVLKDPMTSATKIGEGKYKENLLKAIDWALQLSEEDRPQTVDQLRNKMLAPSPQKGFSPDNFSQPQWSLTNIVGILLIFLFSVTVGILWYENQAHNTKIKDIERILRDAQAKIATEWDARQRVARQLKIAEKQLKIERKGREKVVIKYRKVRAILAQIQDFYPQTVKETTHFDDAKYYDVINVDIDDTLNVREFPGHSSKKVAKVPRKEKCIQFLNHYRLVNSHVWVKIQYKGGQGWVNSSYLWESEHCNGEENVE
ncbi:serine/threonine protein kinase [Candidatus Parabeggiatoa sp. HSG14]|uniref:serine/threonine protein kinase n=1 Tax=Candidatus Parabeggiatoa sp. HSG14 TaxID=3055593 RepID=UPI0025A81248|nr:serine/threonine protein kinase [Thiotrichales bacterium HSG14]